MLILLNLKEYFKHKVNPTTASLTIKTRKKIMIDKLKFININRIKKIITISKLIKIAKIFFFVTKLNNIYIKKNIFIKSVLYLPTPSNLNYIWNFGSLLGLILVRQILTGFFLTLFYCSNINIAFDRVIHIINNVNRGWVIRFIHSTGATVFFIFCYIHIRKALFYNSFYLWKVWFSGFFLIIILIAVAFLGYVLPWGQMSIWGATVITNLISVIPYLGVIIVNWLWGGFNVDAPTLRRFFSFHFILPFFIIVLVMAHLFFLHELGSSNPLGISINIDKIRFKNYFVIKDFYTLILSILFLLILSFRFPFLFIDSENFIKANSMITPIHIQPEWYFLFAYAILRAIPNKLGGVIMLLISIISVFLIPLFHIKKIKGFRFETLYTKIVLFIFGGVFIMLTWLGIKPVEDPFIIIRKIYTVIYFFNLVLIVL